jgi:hypothetical protein
MIAFLKSLFGAKVAPVYPHPEEESGVRLYRINAWLAYGSDRFTTAELKALRAEAIALGEREKEYNPEAEAAKRLQWANEQIIAGRYDGLDYDPVVPVGQGAAWEGPIGTPKAYSQSIFARYGYQDRPYPDGVDHWRLTQDVLDGAGRLREFQPTWWPYDPEELAPVVRTRAHPPKPSFKVQAVSDLTRANRRIAERRGEIR